MVAIHTRIHYGNHNIRVCYGNFPRLRGVDICIRCAARLARVVEVPLIGEIRIVGYNLPAQLGAKRNIWNRPLNKRNLIKLLNSSQYCTCIRPRNFYEILTIREFQSPLCSQVHRPAQRLELLCTRFGPHPNNNLRYDSDGLPVRRKQRRCISNPALGPEHRYSVFVFSGFVLTEHNRDTSSA